MKKVLVLLSTYNGEKYLEEQLESIYSQEGIEATILVRDDGSNDDTVNILGKWKEKRGLNWYKGDNIGPAFSFFELIMKAGQADYYAFSDQDDCWKTNKLLRAIQELEYFPEDKPCLYFSETTLVDRNLKELKGVPNVYISKTFGAAMISNSATGCTEVFNNSLLVELQSYVPNYISMHDSWTNRVNFALGGNLYYDTDSYIRYRQHSNNTIGGKSSLKKRWARRLSYLKNKEKTRSKTAIELCNGYYEKMSYENQKLITDIINYEYFSNLGTKLRLLRNPLFRTGYIKYDFYACIAVLLNVY